MYRIQKLSNGKLLPYLQCYISRVFPRLCRTVLIVTLPNTHLDTPTTLVSVSHSYNITCYIWRPCLREAESTIPARTSRHPNRTTSTQPRRNTRGHLYRSSSVPAKKVSNEPSFTLKRSRTRGYRLTIPNSTKHRTTSLNYLPQFTTRPNLNKSHLPINRHRPTFLPTHIPYTNYDLLKSKRPPTNHTTTHTNPTTVSTLITPRKTKQKRR